MFNHLSTSYKGMLFAFAGFTAFAFGDVASKWLTTDYPVFQVIFVNHGIACLYLLFALYKTEGLKTLKSTRKIKLHLFRGLLNTAVALSVIFSFSILPIADVYTFLFTVPFFSALLALLFYGQKICGNRMIAILIGFAGVLIGLQPGQAGFNPSLLIPVLGGFLIALKFTISRSLEGENILLLGLWPLLVSTTITGVVAMSGFEAITPAHLALHLFSGLTSAVGLVCVSQAFRIAPAAAVSPFLYTEMVWALLFGHLIFGDVPGILMLIGAAIIIISGLYLIETERRRKDSPAPIKS